MPANLSIDQVLSAAFDPVLFEMLKQGGKKLHWTNLLMQTLHDKGHIHYVYLADMLDMIKFNGVSELKQITIPVVWTKQDAALNSSESKKISLVKDLCENLVYSHDDLFSLKYGKEICKLVIAKDYFRMFGDIHEIPEQQAFVRKLHTLYAEVAPM